MRIIRLFKRFAPGLAALPAAVKMTASKNKPQPAGVLGRRGTVREQPMWIYGIYAGICLYLFLAAINIMGSGLKTFGEASDWMQRIFSYGTNPFAALLGALFITAVVQSSSFTTALIITLVASGELSLETAVFAVMGANVGTSVTGIIVSLGNIRIRRQFRRAFTAALMHDIFNLLTVAVLFPLEWATGVLTHIASWATQLIGMSEVENPNNPIKLITRPLVGLVDWLGAFIAPTQMAQGLIVAVAGLILLFAALLGMVKNLRGALLNRLEGLFRTYFFRNDGTSYTVGAVSTVLVQSSSVTTSLIVSLAGAGIVPLGRVFAFMLGANLGTTVTGLIAATANPVAAAVTVALVHVFFNLTGTLIWYPARRVPMNIATWYGRMAAKSKRYAFLFLTLVFVILPLIGLVITEMFFR